jgi:hypothetical protein
MNKAMIESYLRNLLGAVLGAVTIVMGSTGIASPLDFGTAEWLLVANSLWASAVPTLLRYVNKSDPAFGLIAQVAVTSVTKKLEEKVAEEVAKAPAKKPAAKKAPPRNK